ncbi:MAG: (d)CMP kinase [Phycisphaerae bacterium]
MIITIDGPAGSGKSTAARKLAARLGIAYLDTGAMYRAVALAVLRESVSLDDVQSLMGVAEQSDIVLDCGPTYTRVTLNGVDVSEAIRSMAVNGATNYVARVPQIRVLLVEKQRGIGRDLGSLVSEGRDQGSVVFPDANLKFVLDATIDKRATRRFQELVAEGEDASLEDIMENLRNRDRNDQKQWAPLLEPSRATIIDTTKMTIHEVVEKLVEEVEHLRNRASPALR